ncbi:Uncharacterised protein [Mycobacteroides abscessus subsp. abscessus]|nr:Uncharacterised protein [Mycobacteroides abscessus subsp. abscessus]
MRVDAVDHPEELPCDVGRIVGDELARVDALDDEARHQRLPTAHNIPNCGGERVIYPAKTEGVGPDDRDIVAARLGQCRDQGPQLRR